jgi:predicted NUDIX family NTP pyrophosphohydrolase
VPAKTSAGLLLFRVRNGSPEVLIVHPGGPFWVKKDLGAWFIPKGELAAGEEPLAAARREFAEELGSPPPMGEYIPLGSVKHKTGKTVHCWAVAGDFDVATLRSNTFSVEWPPRSGQQREFPEVDRAKWVEFAEAARVMHTAESEFVTRLAQHLLQQPTL